MLDGQTAAGVDQRHSVGAGQLDGKAGRHKHSMHGLDGQGLIHPKVLETVAEIISAPYVFPIDIIERIEADPLARENYKALPEGYKRIRVAYIDAARKRPAEFEKRLGSFLSKTRAGKMITGFGGIDKYYGSK